MAHNLWGPQGRKQKGPFLRRLMCVKFIYTVPSGVASLGFESVWAGVGKCWWWTGREDRVSRGLGSSARGKTSPSRTGPELDVSWNFPEMLFCLSDLFKYSHSFTHLWNTDLLLWDQQGSSVLGVKTFWKVRKFYQELINHMGVPRHRPWHRGPM